MGIKDLSDLNKLVEGNVLLINKPLFWTSFDVVKKVRAIIERAVRRKYETRRRVKVGHAGTLDPLAEGLMVIGTGKQTKMLESIQANSKEYITTLEFGKTTPSFDLETMFDKNFPFSYIPQETFKKISDRFIGYIEQVPPLYSAKNIKGKRAYAAARQGKTLDLKPSRVYIDKIEIIDYAWPIVTINVSCGKGTYIRALARDIGEALETGAHIIGLKRIRIGDYHLRDAYDLKKFEQKINFL
jgi:tRNA pseudouridine55 synthase